MLDNFKDKTIVITGGSGYIGTSLIKELKGQAKRVICVSRKKITKHRDIEVWELDLQKRSSWKQIFKESDVIFHLGGNTSVYHAEQNPEESLISTLYPIMHMINAARELSLVPRIIFASTATVYGLTDALPVSELTEPNPITIYDLHKLFAEQYLMMASKNKIINSTSLRLANVYGPSYSESSSLERGIVNTITNKALYGNELKIFGDGNYMRDYIYIDDVTSALIHTANSHNTTSKTFNVSNQVGFKVKEVIELIAAQASVIIEKKIIVNQVPWPKGVNDIEKRNFIGNSNALYVATNWVPKTTLKQGIAKTINFYWKQINNHT